MNDNNKSTYSHRNGENDEPTVKGWYWTYNDYGDFIPKSVHTHFFDGKTWDNPVAVLFLKDTRYYGPIPEPEEER